MKYKLLISILVLLIVFPGSGFTENKDKKLSNEAILQIRKAHSNWIEDPTAPDGHRASQSDES